MIKQLRVNGEILINVPAVKSELIELGLTAMEADQVMSEQNKKSELEAIRNYRVPLLIEADQLVNIALDKGGDMTLYREYRQKLRDVTKEYDTFETVIWPTKPTL